MCGNDVQNGPKYGVIENIICDRLYVMQKKTSRTSCSIKVFV